MDLAADTSGTKSGLLNPWMLGESDKKALEQQKASTSKHLKRLQPIVNKEIMDQEPDIDDGDDAAVSSGEEWTEEAPDTTSLPNSVTSPSSVDFHIDIPEDLTKSLDADLGITESLDKTSPEQTVIPMKSLKK